MPKSVLSDLFQWSQPKHTVPAGWLCSVCSIHNYDVRKSCRQCGVARAGTQVRGNQSKSPPPSKRVVTTTQPIVHPAAVAEGAKARIVELDIIIATMRNRADCTSVLKDLEADKRCQEELIEKAKPPKRSKFREVEETRAYVGRVEARAQSLDEESEAQTTSWTTFTARSYKTPTVRGKEFIQQTFSGQLLVQIRAKAASHGCTYTYFACQLARLFVSQD